MTNQTKQRGTLSSKNQNSSHNGSNFESTKSTESRPQNKKSAIKKEIQKHKCDFCSETFKLKVALQKHDKKCKSKMFAHNDNIESMCDLCDFVTTEFAEMYKHNLDVHMK